MQGRGWGYSDSSEIWHYKKFPGVAFVIYGDPGYVIGYVVTEAEGEEKEPSQENEKAGPKDNETKKKPQQRQPKAKPLEDESEDK